MIATRIEEATTLEDIQYLWKTDDADWLKQRKEEWSYLKEHKFSDSSAKDLKLNSRYFIYGDVDEYINPYLRYFLTPFNSPEEALKTFNLNRFLFDGQALILNAYISKASQDGQGLPWVKDRISYFILGVLGDSFLKFRGMEKICPDACFWCSQYIRHSKSYLKNDLQYHGVESCVDFFISALGFSYDKPKRFAKLEKESGELFESAKEYLSKPNENKSKNAFAQELMSRKSEIESKILEASKKIGE